MIIGRAALKSTVYVAVLLVLLFNTTAYGSTKFKIEGTIVAWDFMSSLINLFEPFDSPVHRLILVVRVNRILEGEESSKYLLVHYKTLSNEFDLSKDIRTGKSPWKISLIREDKNVKCDQRLSDLIDPIRAEPIKSGDPARSDIKPIPRLMRTAAGEKEKLPMDSLLPCYATILPKPN